MGRRAVNVIAAGAQQRLVKGRGKAALRWSLIWIRGGTTEKDAGSVTCGAGNVSTSLLYELIFDRSAYTVPLWPLMFMFSWLLVVSFKAQSQDRNEISFKGPVQSSYSISRGKCLPERSANAVSLKYTTGASFPYYHPFFSKTAVMLWHFWTGGRKVWESRILKQQFVPNSLENSFSSVCLYTIRLSA